MNADQPDAAVCGWQWCLESLADHWGSDSSKEVRPVQVSLFLACHILFAGFRAHASLILAACQHSIVMSACDISLAHYTEAASLMRSSRKHSAGVRPPAGMETS